MRTNSNLYPQPIRLQLYQWCLSVARGVKPSSMVKHSIEGLNHFRQLPNHVFFQIFHPPKKKGQICHLKNHYIFPASVCVALMISFMALSLSEVGDTCSSNARLHRTTATAARNRSQGSFQPTDRWISEGRLVRLATHVFSWRIREKQLGKKTQCNFKKGPVRHVRQGSYNRKKTEIDNA